MKSVASHRILFIRDEFDLYEETGSWNKKRKELEERHRKAIKELLSDGEVDTVVRFAEFVKQPLRVECSLEFADG